MVIVISSTLVKDAYQAYINPKAEPPTEDGHDWSTVAICIAIFLGSLFPPPALEWIVVFAVGGLASAFFWPLILGLYWMKANEHGAAAGMAGGMATYIIGAGKYLPITFGMNAIVISLVVSFALTVGVSLMTPKTPKGIIMTWFGREYPKKAPA